MAGSRKYDFYMVMLFFASLMLIFMGVSGFANTRGSEYTGPLFKVLGEDWLVYVFSGIIAVIGLGILDKITVGLLPRFVGEITTVLGFLFWLSVVVMKDFVPGFSGMDFGDITAWIQGFAVDFIILLVFINSIMKMKKSN